MTHHCPHYLLESSSTYPGMHHTNDWRNVPWDACCGCQVGGKMPYSVFHHMFHASVTPRAEVILDLGRMHLRPGMDSVPVHQQEADGRRETRDGRVVVCRTHPLFGAAPGTVELELQASTMRRQSESPHHRYRAQSLRAGIQVGPCT